MSEISIKEPLPKPSVTSQTMPQNPAIFQRKEELMRDKKRPLKTVPPAITEEVIESTPPEFIPKDQGIEVVSHALRRELWRRAEFFATRAIPTAAVYVTLAVAIGCENQEFMRQLNVNISPDVGNHINIASTAINAFISGLLGKELLRPMSRFNAAAEQKKAMEAIGDKNGKEDDIAYAIARHKNVGEEKVARWLEGTVNKEDRKNPQVQLVRELRNKELVQLEEEGVPVEQRTEIAKQRVIEAYKRMQELAKEIRGSDQYRLGRIREEVLNIALPAAAAGLGTEAALEQGGPVVGAAAGFIDDIAAAGYGAKKVVRSLVSGVRKK